MRRRECCPADPDPDPCVYCFTVPADAPAAVYRVVASGFVDGDVFPGSCHVEQINGTHDLTYASTFVEDGCNVYHYNLFIGSPVSHVAHFYLGSHSPDSSYTYLPGCDDPVLRCQVWFKAVTNSPQNYIYEWNNGASTFDLCGEAMSSSWCVGHTVGTVDSVTGI